MRPFASKPRGWVALGVLASAVLMGCSGLAEGHVAGLTGAGTGGPVPGGPPAGGVEEPGASPSAPSAGQCTMMGDTTGPCSPWLPARIRRLTNAEYDASVAALLGTEQRPGTAFPGDHRQSGFTRSDDQVVDPVFALAAQQAAEALAQEAVSQRLSVLAPCSTATPDEACARSFITSFASRALRRPLTPEEVEALLAVHRVGAEGEGFAAGIRLVLQAVLQSPSFLYLSELGDAAAPPAAETRVLSGEEAAAALASLLTGGPPDAELLAAAAAGALRDGTVRAAHARRLLQGAGARRQLQALVLEWLGIDAVEGVTKSAAVVPGFDALRPHLLAEARALVDEAFFQGGGLRTLLGADFTTVSPELAAFYGLPASGRVSLAGTPRRGILSQAAFLSVHAHPSDSGPVLRGVAVLRRLLCQTLPNPGELNLEVVPPPPDPTRTTRERFAQHATDAACSGCHRLIDPVGFAFEHFDAAGRLRATDNGLPVDTTGELLVSDAAGAFRSSEELTLRLAESEDVRTCFARNLVRFAAARSQPGVEEAFLLRVWRGLPEAHRGDAVELLVAYVASDLFITRRTP